MNHNAIPKNNVNDKIKATAKGMQCSSAVPNPLHNKNR